MTGWAWLGGVVAGLLVVWGSVLFASGVWQLATMERDGRHWSQEELYECELAPSCDEEVAAEESRLWRQTKPADEGAAMIAGFLMIGMAVPMGAASVSSLLGSFDLKGGS